MTTETSDRHWMLRALALARRGLGTTQPNPMVGAIVLDRSGKIAGSGFHLRAGEPHAEIIALNAAGDKARGGTLYVTLEPCTHVGKTPPCVDRVAKSGLKRVVIAMLDPNPVVHSRGAKELRRNGIDVSVGCLEEKARKLNLPFERFILKDLPFVTAKVAVSEDGKMGTVGQRLILTGPAEEKFTMKLRAEAGAILVGVGTVISDDPRLSVRGKFADRKPIRAILDPALRTPMESRLFKETGGPVWIFCSNKSGDSKKLQGTGAKVIPLQPNAEHKFPLKEILSTLASVGVTGLLVEGGRETLQEFARQNLVDRWVFYVTRARLGSKVDGRKTISLPPEAPFPPPADSKIRKFAATDIAVWTRA